ncbi:MAG TPA: M14 family metallopeptidase [Phycisphaerales bacterium]|nr:M14 family metallopeptidase [Phycisphaerales bacterium]
MRTKLIARLARAASLALPLACAAQDHIAGKVDIPFNRYYTYDELVGWTEQIARSYPEIVRLERIGASGLGKPMYVAIVNAPETGPDTAKPAMWIDGNVHGNEIQSAEVVLYSLWYLAKAYGQNADLTELLNNYSFYFVVSQNPDGRDYWFEAANNPSSSRSNQRPEDSDRDGLVDEDPDDDLDGDGSITTMWIADPDGEWVRDEVDPRIFRRVREDERGEWTRLGEEGLDNDGDGRTNEDPPGGDDMNRNWPTDWKPGYVQFGAGEFPLSNPETRAVAQFILAHPNIAAGQSYHNAGGMILRGPGAEYQESAYPREDVAVYDEIGKTGEDILPYYRYMITYKDLYGVHGGFINWLAEGLGVFAFTNEMWSGSKYFQRDVSSPDEERMWLFRDRLQFGQAFKEYEEFDHPEHGPVLIGGLNRWSSRNTPTFMLEEECHRNFAFTMYHADQMPLLEWGDTEIERIGGDDLWVVTIEVKNTKLMPTRSAVQARSGIGSNDLLLCEPGEGARVVMSGSIRERRDKTIDEVRFEPGRVQLPGGVPGKDSVLHRFYLEGPQGTPVKLTYSAERAKDIETGFVLEARARD